MIDFLTEILKIISIEYVLCVIIATYIVIILVNAFRLKGIKTWFKRIISIVVGIILWFVYHKLGLITAQVAIPSFLVSVVAYDYFIKAIINKFSMLKHKE